LSILLSKVNQTAESSKFVGFAQAGNYTHWLKSFERSIADFVPLLPLGGVLTFGLIAIALRRSFERKYTR
jgi:hypothetical protein